MKRSRVCGGEFVPLPLPPSPMKVMLGLPEPWEEICPSCGVKLAHEVARFGISIVYAWREQERKKSNKQVVEKGGRYGKWHMEG